MHHPSPCHLTTLPRGGHPNTLLRKNYPPGLCQQERRKGPATENSDETWFSDSSSLVREGGGHARYAAVTPFEIIAAKALLPGTSAQSAELITLTRTSQFGRDKRVHIYTDSKYAFLVLHAHAAIWKESGFLTVKDTPIKYGPQILSLPEIATCLRRWQ